MNLRGFAFCVAILMVSNSAIANPFAFAWQELAPGVWAGIRQDPFELPQEGNSVFVVTSQGVVVFDAGGSPLMGESIVAKVRSVTDKPITHVVISHWHGDHMRGLQSLVGVFPNAAVLTHPHSRERIAATQDRWLVRRVKMVPGIRKMLEATHANGLDLAGRPLIPAERAWIEQASTIVDQLDRENKRTAYVVPAGTFDGRLTLHLGGREIDFFDPGRAHTAGDIIMWLPQERIVATGDVVTVPIPLMSSPYVNEYPATLARIKALDFRTLVPGHGAVQHDVRYLDLLSETFTTTSVGMKELMAKGLSNADAIAKLDLSSIEAQFTHGDLFLRNRFQDYVADSLPLAAYLAETGAEVPEDF